MYGWNVYYADFKFEMPYIAVFWFLTLDLIGTLQLFPQES